MLLRGLPEKFAKSSQGECLELAKPTQKRSSTKKKKNE